MAVPKKILQKNPKRMKKMYENVKSETITISREEYDNLSAEVTKLKRERDEYRNVALDLSNLCRTLKGGDSA